MPRIIHVTLFFLLVAGNVSVYRAIFAPSVLTVRVLAVGKGDAVLVQSPNGKTLLIETGPDASVLRALGSALPVWQRHIDGVIITSNSRGSAGGLPDVIDRYRIGTLIRSGTRGQRFILGDTVYIDVLWPPQTATPLNTANGRSRAPHLIRYDVIPYTKQPSTACFCMAYCHRRS